MELLNPLLAEGQRAGQLGDLAHQVLINALTACSREVALQSTAVDASLLSAAARLHLHRHPLNPRRPPLRASAPAVRPLTPFRTNRQSRRARSCPRTRRNGRAAGKRRARSQPRARRCSVACLVRAMMMTSESDACENETRSSVLHETRCWFTANKRTFFRRWRRRVIIDRIAAGDQTTGDGHVAPLTQRRTAGCDDRQRRTHTSIHVTQRADSGGP